MRQVYLDHAAATPVDPRVFAAMQPFMQEGFGNPSSFHMAGKEVADAVLDARTRIAGHLAARPDEVVFTSGGTESDNLAILGYARANKEKGNHLVTTAIEHEAVLEAMNHLQRKEGFEVTIVPVESDGRVDPKAVIAALRPDTLLVSVMLANNEIGTLQPVAEIGRQILEWKEANGRSELVFHTDACQAAGVADLDVRALHVDMLTLNGSKIYGPKGIGVLYARRGLKLQPLQFGGAQEKKLRPGTQNVAGIIGLAAALDFAQSEKEEENMRLVTMRDAFIKRVLETVPKTRLNGHPEERLPNNVNISFMDIEGEALLLYLDAQGIYASTGSACTSASLDPSHVILALGVPFEVAHGSLRFTLGRSTTQADLDYVLEHLPGLVEKLRKISPVNVSEQYF